MCQESFNYHGELINNMCDNCILRIAEIEQLYLPKNINVTTVRKHSKPILDYTKDVNFQKNL